MRRWLPPESPAWRSAGAAFAATGDLTPQGCIDDNDTGPDSCAQATDGLEGARAVVVSPDGRSVYAASQFDDAVVRFDRDPATGALTPQGCVDDNDTGGDTCAQSTDGLRFATSLVASPDGSSLYAASDVDEAVVIFGRDNGAAAGTDTDPPETSITKGPKKKTEKRKAKFAFASDEAGATFLCKLEKKDFKPCDMTEKFKVKLR